MPFIVPFRMAEPEYRLASKLHRARMTREGNKPEYLVVPINIPTSQYSFILRGVRELDSALKKLG